MVAAPTTTAITTATIMTTMTTTPSTRSPSTCPRLTSLLLDALTQLVTEFGILRAKGFAAIPGKPMRLLIQGVGTRFDKHFDRAWRSEEPRITRLVLIGQDLDATQLEARLRQALGA